MTRKVELAGASSSAPLGALHSVPLQEKHPEERGNRRHSLVVNIPYSLQGQGGVSATDTGSHAASICTV